MKTPLYSISISKSDAEAQGNNLQSQKRFENRLPLVNIFFQFPQIDMPRSLYFLMGITYCYDMGECFWGSNIYGITCSKLRVGCTDK